MTNKKDPKKNNIKKVKITDKKNYKPLLLVISISLIIALLLPYVKENETYIDNDIALNKLENNFLE
jgi:hypothetical protein